MDEFPSQGDLRIILIPCAGRASTFFLPPFYVLTVINFFFPSAPAPVVLTTEKNPYVSGPTPSSPCLFKS